MKRILGSLTLTRLALCLPLNQGGIMKYACVQRYFDTGTVKAFVVEAKGRYASDYTKSFDRYDEYCDVFDTREEALLQCERESREA